MWLGLTTSDWLGITGMVIAIIGFGFTLWQLHRVRSAVVADQRRIAGAMLRSEVAELDRIDQEIRLSETHAIAKRGVLDWRRAAADIQALAERLEAPDEHAAEFTDAVTSLKSALVLSLGMCDAVLDELREEGISASETCAPFLSETGRACAASRTITTAMLFQEPS